VKLKIDISYFYSVNTLKQVTTVELYEDKPRYSYTGSSRRLRS